MTLRLGARVAEVEPEARRVRLADGGVERYDLLLLATGSEPRTLPDLPGALRLRTAADAERLRRDLLDGPLTVVGAGFIGCEVAASARALGREVTVLEAAAVPLERVLGARLGAWLAGVHRDRGVDLRTFVADLGGLRGTVLAAVGTQPRTALAEAAGIECAGGVLVDGQGRTSAPGVFAAGDCARFLSPLYGTHVRVEHFQTAWRHGAATGRAMAGAGADFAEAPWFWSDQFDLNLQYAGAGVPWDREVVRGELGRPPFTVFQLAGGRLVGALGVNDARTVSRTRRLLESGVEMAAGLLEDPAFDLRRALP